MLNPRFAATQEPEWTSLSLLVAAKPAFNSTRLTLVSEMSILLENVIYRTVRIMSFMWV